MPSLVGWCPRTPATRRPPSRTAVAPSRRRRNCGVPGVLGGRPGVVVAQRRFDDRDEHGRVDRVGQVAIGPAAEAGRPVLRLPAQPASHRVAGHSLARKVVRILFPALRHAGNRLFRAGLPPDQDLGRIDRIRRLKSVEARPGTAPSARLRVTCSAMPDFRRSRPTRRSCRSWIPLRSLRARMANAYHRLTVPSRRRSIIRRVASSGESAAVSPAGASARLRTAICSFHSSWPVNGIVSSGT